MQLKKKNLHILLLIPIKLHTLLPENASMNIDTQCHPGFQGLRDTLKSIQGHIKAITSQIGIGDIIQASR